MTDYFNNIDVFAELGRRLKNFGSDERSRQVVRQAVTDNPWFTECDMVFAVRALCEQMLNRRKLAEWITPYDLSGCCSAGKKLGIIMAGNIPFVGFADLLYGIVCGYECHIKISSKDSVGMSYIADLLEDISRDIRIGRSIEGHPDALIASGSDDTMRTLRAIYPGVRSLFRGTRSSAAVLSGDESEAALRLLADDIFTYNGLGCRNVSLLFVPEGFDLHRVAGIFGKYSSVNPKYLQNYRQTRALALMESPVNVIDGGFFTLVAGDYFPHCINQINCITYTNIEEVDRWLAAHDERLQCVVSDFYPHPSAVPFGRAQFPGLSDYPDRIDVVEFLCGCRLKTDKKCR